MLDEPRRKRPDAFSIVMILLGIGTLLTATVQAMN